MLSLVSRAKFLKVCKPVYDDTDRCSICQNVWFFIWSKTDIVVTYTHASGLLSLD